MGRNGFRIWLVALAYLHLETRTLVFSNCADTNVGRDRFRVHFVRTQDYPLGAAVRTNVQAGVSKSVFKTGLNANDLLPEKRKLWSQTRQHHLHVLAFTNGYKNIKRCIRRSGSGATSFQDAMTNVFIFKQFSIGHNMNLPR